ncbi:MAG: SemiSWEET transporter [Maricaulaceae bacterium]
MTYVDMIGYIAAFLTSASFLPQAIMVIKTRNTKALSLTMYSMFTLGVTLWMVYGVSSQDWPIVLSNAVTLIFAVTILSIIISNILNERRAFARVAIA